MAWVIGSVIIKSSDELKNTLILKDVFFINMSIYKISDLVSDNVYTMISMCLMCLQGYHEVSAVFGEGTRVLANLH